MKIDFKLVGWFERNMVERFLKVVFGVSLVFFFLYSFRFFLKVGFGSRFYIYYFFLIGVFRYVLVFGRRVFF